IPDAGKAVQNTLDGYPLGSPVPPQNSIINRLTPLFSFYSTKAENHFYTTSPQMAAAARDGTLLPRPRAKIQDPVYFVDPGSGFCSLTYINVNPPQVVVEPDGVTAVPGAEVQIVDMADSNRVPTFPFISSAMQEGPIMVANGSGAISGPSTTRW